MRAAGIFSHLVMAFLCASLTVLALDTVPMAHPVATADPMLSADPYAETRATASTIDADQTEHPAHAAASPAEPATAVPREAATSMDHWAASARPLEATAPAIVSESALPAIAPATATPLHQLSAVTQPDPAPSAGPAPLPGVVASPAQPALKIAAADPAPSLPPPTSAITDPAIDPLASGGTPGLKPAKVLFGAVASPAPLSARAIGSYSRGCLSGAQALPVDGPTWQAMRLSRNRNWGHPKLIKLIEKLAADGKEKDGWPGLLIGDIAQPRGGPMLTGHASHQIGLDADIWLTPMPDRRLTNKERETIEATSMLGDDALTVNRDVWTEGHLNILRRAASYPDVERIFVHPAIKQVLCYAAKDDRSWLSKVRPYWGHHYHFHVRIHCPPGSAGCAPQASVPGDDGCGKELDDWLKLIANIKPEPVPLPIPPPVAAAKPAKEKPPMTLDQLPQECSVVLANGNPKLQGDIAAAAKAVEAAKAAKLAEAAALAANKSATKTAGKAASSTKSADVQSANAKVDAHAAAAKALALPAAEVRKPVAVEKKSATQ